MNRPHPLGLTAPEAGRPEWQAVERRRHALRVADRQRRIVHPKPPLSVLLRRWIGEFFG